MLYFDALLGSTHIVCERPICDTGPSSGCENFRLKIPWVPPTQVFEKCDIQTTITWKWKLSERLRLQVWLLPEYRTWDSEFWVVKNNPHPLPLKKKFWLGLGTSSFGLSRILHENEDLVRTWTLSFEFSRIPSPQHFNILVLWVVSSPEYPPPKILTFWSGTWWVGGNGYRLVGVALRVNFSS